MKQLSWLSTFWRALLIGSADVIPGVSGGTVALITGLYARLTALIATLAQTPLAVLRTRSFKPLRAVEWGFAFALGTGVILAIAIASRTLPQLLATYPTPVYALFVGLIVATAVIILLEHITRLTHVLIGLCATMIGLVTLIVSTQSPSVSTVALFILGLSAGFIMLLPGVSGSYLLLVTGHYTIVLSALAEPLAHLALLIPFAVGVGAGILSAALTVTKLLRVAKQHTMVALGGLMLGALAHPITLVLGNATTTFDWALASTLVLVGVVLIILLQRKAAAAAA